MKNLYFQKVFFKKNFLITILVIMMVLLSLHIYAASTTEKYLAKINDKNIILELADTDQKRQLGLMFRDELEENHGMIFTFEQPKQVSFWMKNVKFPLDILFIYKNKVVKIYNMVPGCETEPCEIYPSIYKVDYVIELNGGYCQKNDITVGQKVEPSSELYKKIYEK